MRTVRPRSIGRTSLTACLIVFCLTATIVYRWGYESWTPTNSKTTYTATAYVVERPRDAATSELRFPIVCTDEDAQQAEQSANSKAEGYVRDRYADWQQRTEGPCLKARQATERSRRAVARAEARLEAFQRQLATKAAKPQAAVREEQKPSAATMVDNPAWDELNGQLRDLQRRYDALAADRTPSHPAVQEVQDRIDDIKRQMESVARQVPSETSAKSESTVGEPHIAARDQERLDDLTAAFDRAREASEEAEAAEKSVVRLQQTGPQYSIEAAKVVEIAATPDYGWRRLMYTTLIAGVLMAVGVGSLSSGVNIEPTVGTTGDLCKATKATVVGTIPAHDPVPDAAKRGWQQRLARRTLISLGLGLIAVCPVFAIWGVGGI